MQRRYKASEYAEMGEEVRRFRLLLEEFLTHTVTSRPSPVGQWEFPLEGHEAEVTRLMGELAEVSGIAQRGASVAEAHINSSGYVLNPVSSWLTITQPKAMLGREDVLSACRMAEGRLSALERQARAAERTLAGKVAALIAWPRYVRELAGFEADSRAGRATVWTLSAFLFAIVTSLVASALVALGALVLNLF